MWDRQFSITSLKTWENGVPFCSLSIIPHEHYSFLSLYYLLRARSSVHHVCSLQCIFFSCCTAADISPIVEGEGDGNRSVLVYSRHSLTGHQQNGLPTPTPCRHSLAKTELPCLKVASIIPGSIVLKEPQMLDEEMLPLSAPPHSECTCMCIVCA